MGEVTTVVMMMMMRRRRRRAAVMRMMRVVWEWDHIRMGMGMASRGRTAVPTRTMNSLVGAVILEARRKRWWFPSEGCATIHGLELG
jgi:hypothetical protein